jgi:hypothetical protein
MTFLKLHVFGFGTRVWSESRANGTGTVADPRNTPLDLSIAKAQL